jgi:LPS O-antigen subunit length determinant protein (WzzB/FepE family)
MKNHKEELDILPILWQWKKAIIWSVLGIMILIGGISLLLPDYYKASVLFYPVSEALQQPIVNAADGQLTLFGNDRDVDRLLSIANSQALKQELIESLDLYTHYGLNKENRKDRIKIHNKIDKFYTVEKTSFDAIKVSFEDLSPEKASTFANTALQNIDAKAVNLASQSRIRLTSSLEDEIKKKSLQLSAMTENIKSLQEEFNIYDAQFQAEALANMESKSPKDPIIQKRIKDYTKGVAEVKQFEVQQELLSKIIIYEQNELDKLRANQGSDINAVHVIEFAAVPDEKSRPRRTILVLGAGLLWFIICCLWILILSAIRQRSWEPTLT